MAPPGTDDMDLYELLGAQPDASDKELQRAFRKQAIRFHPDKNPGVEAAARFHLLTIAIDTLLDASKRQQYDASRKAARQAAEQKAKIEGERRAWIEALETNEREAQTLHSDRKRKRQEEETRQATLAREGAEMREALAKKRNAQLTSQQASAATASTQSTRAEASSIFSSEDCTVKMRFTNDQLSSDDLKALFSKFGYVRELIYRQKQNKVQSALVEYDRIGSALDAVQATTDDLPSIGFKSCAWAFGRIPDLGSLQDKMDDTHDISEPKSRAKQRFKFNKPSTSTVGKPVVADSETDVLRRMRQAQRERDKVSQHS
jgi:DnaJ family protein C protein 17